MKSTFFSFATLAAGVIAQDLNSLPECSRNCINALISEGPNYGCPADGEGGQPSAACLCSKSEFAYGIRDCANESCPSGTSLDTTNQYGLSYCSSAEPSASGTSLAAIGIFSTATASVTASGSASSTGESSMTTTESSSSSSETESSSSSSSSSEEESSTSSSAVTTVPVVSTITSDSSTIETTVGSSTSFEAASSSAGAALGRSLPGAGFAGFGTGPVVGLTVVLGGLVGGVFGLIGLLNA